MDKAIQFFTKVIGREPSPAEQRGEFGLDVLLALIDARVPIVAEKVRDEAIAVAAATPESEAKVEPAKPDPENGAAPFSEAPAGSES